MELAIWYAQLQTRLRHVMAADKGSQNGTGGLSAWRWLFILEGIPSVCSAFLVFFFLPDYPETARWLSTTEKKLAAERLRLEGSHGHSEHMTWIDAKATLTDWRLYAHYAVCTFGQVGV